MPNLARQHRPAAATRLEQEFLRLLAALRQHAVADKAVADPTTAGTLRSSGDPTAVVSAPTGLFRAHDLAEFHHVGRAEECMPSTVLRAFCHRGDLVDVQIECWTQAPHPCLLFVGAR